MIRYSLLFIFGIIIFACNQQDASQPASKGMNLSGFETTEYPGGVTRAIKKDPNGTVIIEGYVKDGKKHGLWTTYSREDVVESTQSYIDGVLYGKSFEYDHRRQIIKEETYINGKLYGKQGTYKFGRPKLEEYYVNNLRHGPYRKYFETGAEQGKISQTVDYVNGKIDGKVRNFNPKGELIVDYDYKDGEKVGGGIVE